MTVLEEYKLKVLDLMARLNSVNSEDCTGEVKIDGEVVKYKERKKVQKLLRDRIGYLFQNFALPLHSLSSND